MAKRTNNPVISESTEETVSNNENLEETAEGELHEDNVAEASIKVYTEKELNEEVEVYLFKDDDKYKDDVFVQVNGKNVLIPRGKPAKIKRKYALALEESNNQDQITSQNIAALLAKDF